jgi:hypothetical protein
MNLGRRSRTWPRKRRSIDEGVIGRGRAALVELVAFVPAVPVGQERDATPSWLAALVLNAGTTLRLRRRAGARGAALMLRLSRAVHVFVAVEPFDLGGSFDAIAGGARRLGLDPDGRIASRAPELLLGCGTDLAGRVGRTRHPKPDGCDEFCRRFR